MITTEENRQHERETLELRVLAGTSYSVDIAEDGLAYLHSDFGFEETCLLCYGDINTIVPLAEKMEQLSEAAWTAICG